MIRKKTAERINPLLFYGGDVDYTSDDIPILDQCNINTKNYPFIPIIQRVNDPQKYIGHFYIDDFQFNRFWVAPERYVKHLNQYHAVVGPDFSTYSNMPDPVLRYNLYRNALLSLIWQRNGVNIIPNVTWPVGRYHQRYIDPYLNINIICISNIGLARDEKELFEKEILMILQCHFDSIIIYGTTCKALSDNTRIIFKPQYINAREV